MRKLQIPLEANEVEVCQQSILGCMKDNPLAIFAEELLRVFSQKNPKDEWQPPMLTDLQALVTMKCLAAVSKGHPLGAMGLNIAGKIQLVFKNAETAKPPVKSKKSTKKQ